MQRLSLAALLESVLAAQVHAAAIVDLLDLDPGVIADIQHVLHLLGALELQVLDVDHAVLAGSQLHESADGDDADDLAVVERADLGYEYDVVNRLLRGAARLDVDGGDEDAAEDDSISPM